METENKEISQRVNKLTEKEKRFCYEWCIDFNATQAAIRAGYSAKTAYSIGQRLLKKPDISELLENLLSNLAETSGISALKIIREHEKLAFSSLGNIHNTWIKLKEFDTLTEDQKACIQEISSKTVKVKQQSGEFADVEYIKIKLFDKQRSLDSLANILGFNAPVKNEVTGANGKDLISPVPVDLKRLSDDELVVYHALLCKLSKKD